MLPLENISPNPDEEYFADGITEELISTISKALRVGVIARTSVMRYKKTSKSIADIGKELGVERVVEGSVRKAGTKLRITAQLVDATSEESLWSETYDREVEDGLTIQRDIAERVADALKVEIIRKRDLPVEKSATRKRGTYEHYLKGRTFLNRRTEEVLRRGIEHFSRAIDADPEYSTGVLSPRGLLCRNGSARVCPSEGCLSVGIECCREGPFRLTEN